MTIRHKVMGGETANDGGHERKGADHKDDGDSDDSDEILQMSDGELEESDGFFGIDESTKENENNVEVPVGKEIDDNDPFFADADDHNEGEENEEGEGAISGSNKPDMCFIVVDLIVTAEKTMRLKEEKRIRIYCLPNRTSPLQRKSNKGRELKAKQTMNREPRRRKKKKKKKDGEGLGV
jgi:hypothetical protein